MANTPNYEIDPNDSRITAVKDEGMKELSDHDAMAEEIKGNTDKYFDGLKEGIEDYKDKQTKLQNEQTNLTIQGIEQDIDDLKKDYTKEQSGAYVDWQKQSNQYGAESEKMAATGLANTGYSESSQVSMYNQYQNRVAIARETFIRAETDFKNKIAEAKLQNSSMLAEIAFNALQQELQLSLQQTQYNNQLLQELSSQRNAIKQSIWNRYQNVIDNINAENALAEQVRVNNSEIAYRDVQTQLAKKEMEKLQEEIATERAARIAKYSTGGDPPGGSTGIKKTNNKGTSAKKTSPAGNQKIQQTAAKEVSQGDTKASYTIDTDSAMKAAGPVNAAQMDRLVRDGYVEDYEENGQIKFKKSAKAIASSLNFNNNLKKAYLN